MKKENQMAYRIAVYITGLLSIAFGVAFSVNSNLGISPVTALPYTLSHLTNVPLSSAVIVVFGIFVAIQIALNRSFRISDAAQILFAVVFGYFTDFTKWILGSFTLPTYLGQLSMLAISMLFIAVGVILYLEAKLVPMPMEGLQLVLSKKSGKEFGKVKVLVDSAAVSLSMLLSFLVAGKIIGIREGTVLTALALGRIISLIRPFIVARLNLHSIETAAKH